jgi:hypothetical protein
MCDHYTHFLWKGSLMVSEAPISGKIPSEFGNLTNLRKFMVEQG